MINEWRNFSRITLLALSAGMLVLCANVEAQRARFPDFFSSQGSSLPAPPSNLSAIPGSFQSPSIITSPPIQLTPPPATFQQPNFSLSQPNFAPPGVLQGPAFAAPNNFAPNLTPTFNPQTPSQPFPIFPRATQPPVQQFPQVQQQFVQPQFGVPQFAAPPQRNNWPQQAWESFQTQFLPRLLERPRVRQTYLPGNNGNELSINDLELGTTMTFPNFLQGPTPLRMSPGFIFHWWNGPDSVAHPGFDLPPRAYSAYLAFDHVTNPSRVSGLESNLTIGYYSDFNNTSSDAIRMTAKLLGWYRVNCYIVGKLGIEYLDRVNVKILPAVGLYMTPNPDMKFDLYFPRSKLAHRIPNLRNSEAWAYLGAEYGGGSWAIERADGTPDQADINDVRAFVGVEWMGPRRVTGFFEFGYVFERELLYRSDPLTELELQDTLMIRSGFEF